jgi:hypothetical protein
MFWTIAASAFLGMVVGACVGVLVMALIVVSGRATEPVQIRDQR